MHGLTQKVKPTFYERVFWEKPLSKITVVRSSGCSTKVTLDRSQGSEQLDGPDEHLKVEYNNATRPFGENLEISLQADCPCS
jgi:hypothetical protein